PTLPGEGPDAARRQRYRRTGAVSVHGLRRNRDNSSMFTGIVRERGRIESVDGDASGVRLVIDAPATAAGASLGDSVAGSGVCLTAAAATNGPLAFDAVPETLRRSSLAELVQDDAVNLEPALRAGEPLGGHYVQGHVDGVGRVRAIAAEGDGRRIWI